MIESIDRGQGSSKKSLRHRISLI